jgi:membrane protease YdiL (CAAX protease family)
MSDDFNTKKSFPEPVEALSIILVVFGALIILLMLISSLFEIRIDPPDVEKEARYLFIFGGSLFLIVPLIYSGWRRYDIRNLFRLNRISLPVALLTVVCGIALAVLSDEMDRLLNMLVTMPDWMLEQMQPLHAATAGEWVMVLSGAVLIAGISEEAMFRGFLQVSLEQKGDATRAVLLSAITWTLIHMNPYWAVQIFISGVVIGFLAWRTDSLIPPILMHIINNLLAVLSLNLNLEAMMQWYLWNDHVAPWILLMALAALVWSIRTISAIYRSA